VSPSPSNRKDENGRLEVLGTSIMEVERLLANSEKIVMANARRTPEKDGDFLQSVPFGEMTRTKVQHGGVRTHHDLINPSPEWLQETLVL
jgi:hypothetical protein